MVPQGEGVHIFGENGAEMTDFARTRVANMTHLGRESSQNDALGLNKYPKLISLRDSRRGTSRPENYSVVFRALSNELI